MKLSVTPFDIDQGTPNNPGFCPIALALRRALPGALNVEVTPLVITLEFPKTSHYMSADTPMIARRFMLAFDKCIADNDLPEPITFDLDLK